MPRPRLLRRLALLFALLHLLVPPLAALADARLQREDVQSAHAVVHVEDHGSPTCPRVHPTDCGFCHIVANLAAPARAAVVLPLVERAAMPPVSTRLGTRAAARSPLARPRAPPLA